METSYELESRKQRMKKYSLIKENFPNTDYIDQDGVSHDSPAAYLWDILGGCGCGSADELGEKAVKVLRLFATDTDFNLRKFIYEDTANEILAHWMDSKGLIEHGTSIGGSWLTEEGKQVWNALSPHIQEESL
jgi:hypothetical protein